MYMIRKNYFLPQKQIDWLDKISKELGISVSEVLRRIVERHMIDFADKPSASQSKKKGSDNNGRD